MAPGKEGKSGMVESTADTVNNGSLARSGGPGAGRAPEAWPDRLVARLDLSLRRWYGIAGGRRPCPAAAPADPPAPALDPEQRRVSQGLMRVNHAGEVCAQGLYRGQAAAARGRRARQLFREAAAEERDHLAWCRERLYGLGASPSRLGPCWHFGSFAIGLLVGAAGGDRRSLGFMAETERQVLDHLRRHLRRLPAPDAPSRVILQQMIEEEAAHGASAREAGGVAPNAAGRRLMRLCAKIMTASAYWL